MSTADANAARRLTGFRFRSVGCSGFLPLAANAADKLTIELILYSKL
jgi:hypothetical protein